MTFGNKVVHLELLDNEPNDKDFYFGSISAIYDKFNSKQIGVTLRRLRDFTIDKNNPYTNKLIIIRIGELKRKKGINKASIRLNNK